MPCPAAAIIAAAVELVRCTAAVGPTCSAAAAAAAVAAMVMEALGPLAARTPPPAEAIGPAWPSMKLLVALILLVAAEDTQAQLSQLSQCLMNYSVAHA